MLGQFQQYLLSERHLCLARQITEADLHGWFAFLNHTASTVGKTRTALSIEMYVNSARILCLWLVEQGVLSLFQVSEDAFPRTRSPLPFLIEPTLFEQFVRASVLATTNEPQAHQMLARDQAILWMFFETGISASELCALKRSDVDLEAGALRVQGQDSKERRMIVGPCSLHALRVWLNQARTAPQPCGSEEGTDDALLFSTERGHALTINSLALLFHRLHKRAGMGEIKMTPSLLRHSFALRYLQAGGDPRGLQDLLGYQSMAPVRQYLRWHEQLQYLQTKTEAEET